MAGSSGKRLHFIVEVHGKTPEGRATLNVLSHHATVASGFKAFVAVLLQWEASHGAIPVGTAVKLKDTRDGGTILCLEYLGFESDTLLGR
jgi:hypothetical protein